MDVWYWSLHKVSHRLKASKVNETRVGKVTRIVVVDTEEEVQSEGRDHGSKELETEETQEKRKKKTMRKWTEGREPPKHKKIFALLL